MPAVPASLFNPSDPTNPNVGYSVEASSIGNWYVHLQTVDIMYVRRNQYDTDTSSTLASPAVTSNWMDMNCTAQTQGEIYYNVAFSAVDTSTGTVFQPHVLQLATNTGVSGGFGTDGNISTSAMGIIRRAARIDAAGTVLDPLGICTQNLSLVMDQMPGAYDPAYDTSATTNGIIAQAMGQVAEACPAFKATLVDL